MITPDLVRWQHQLYPRNHVDRRNLLIHLCTAPLFLGGLASVITGIARLSLVVGLSGLAAMVIAVAAQGRGHRLEAEPPVPFRSPLDVVARLFVEQLVTFPRFVLSGGFSRAWAAAR